MALPWTSKGQISRNCPVRSWQAGLKVPKTFPLQGESGFTDSRHHSIHDRFHAQLSLWTMGFLIALFLSPFVGDGHYGVASLHDAFPVFTIVFFGEEMMYDRSVKTTLKRSPTGVLSRVATLVGVSGNKTTRYRLLVLLSHLNASSSHTS
ncbi:hypothetical protein NEOLEDRAFT_1070916 [Neolentinus lepideus HHB14362 ss-1]|uniref:Uncharacterized protein n=1 Tax=Neolentinus lepideus HHB14362 ss-1 TaxID=1314782 RepID=A0A165QRD4_9AGAM|nr:hypothetical protein NEOLEDRAFT_1070916 [Neolentinus lepideus HHB14362 ss-1]